MIHVQIELQLLLSEIKKTAADVDNFNIIIYGIEYTGNSKQAFIDFLSILSDRIWYDGRDDYPVITGNIVFKDKTSLERINNPLRYWQYNESPYNKKY